MEVLCAQLISPGEPEKTCVGRSKGPHFGQGTCVKSVRGCIHGLLTKMCWATVLYCVVQVSTRLHNSLVETCGTSIVQYALCYV